MVNDWVLGIDVGTATTGWGVVGVSQNKFTHLDFGVIKTSKYDDTSLRLKNLYQEIVNLIKYYKPIAMAVEEIYFFKNQKTIVPVSQARGVILLAGAQSGLKIGNFSPPQVKSAVTGFGRADKLQVQEMVKKLLGLKVIPKPDDAADALAVAICYLNTNHL